MAKNIPIHPNDDTFKKLLQQAAKALRTDNGKLLKKVKSKFSEANISLFYNEKKDVVRVLRKDSPPIDFSVSNWTDLPKDQSDK